MDNQVYVPFVLVGGLIAYYLGKRAWQAYVEWRLVNGDQAAPAPAKEAPKKVDEPLFLVLEGPEKGLLVALGPHAKRGGRGDEGTWVCTDRDDRIHVHVEGLDSQLGVVVLDLYALLGEDEAKATLARRIRVMPESWLHLVDQTLGGFTAMEGWLKVPSLANYKPPQPDELPVVLPLTLDLGETSVTMMLSRDKLLEVAERRTSPQAAERTARPGKKAGPMEVLQMVQDRYTSDPGTALALLQDRFGTGSLPTDDPSLTCGLAQIWGLTLRNLGRYDEAVARFTEGLDVAVSTLAMQELHYNRGYARLCSMMTSRQDHGDGQVTSAFDVDARHADALGLCLADFEAAARLGPDDGDAQGQVELTKKLLASIA